MELRTQQQDWDELAELDPYWAVLTSPEHRFGRWEPDEFFETGASEIESVLRKAERFRRPLNLGSALDFGCGLGRLTRALAAEFDTCIGVDISPLMVAAAEKLNAESRNCEFVVNNEDSLRLFASQRFDMIYGSIVLQHVPDKDVIRTYVAEFCRILSPGGLLVFQLPSDIPLIYRFQVRRRLYLLLRAARVPPSFMYRRLRLIPIAMSSLPEAEVTSLLRSNGVQVLEVETKLAEAGIKSSTYFATK